MSEKSSENAPFSFWSDDMMAAQRSYWDAWSSMCRQGLQAGGTPGHAAAGPWTDTFDRWWKAVSGSTPPNSADAIARIVDQSRAFFAIGEQLTHFIAGVSDASKASGKWQEELAAKFDEMKRMYSQFGSADMPAALRGLMAFSQLPLDTWNRTAAGAALFPGDFMKGWKPEAWEPVQFRQGVDQFLSVPGVGYTREAQAQAQAGMRFLLDYQSAFAEYVKAHARLGVETLDRLYAKIIALGEQGKELNTLRQIYDLWVDCSEECYNDFVMTDEFAQVYGRLVNALMKLKHHGGQVVDENLGAMNMPTRKELNTLLVRQQEQRRAMRALQTELERNQVGTLKRELGEVRKQVGAPERLREQIEDLRAEYAATRERDAALIERLQAEMSTLREEMVRADAAAPVATAASGPDIPKPARGAKRASAARAAAGGK